jgi:hypothetical protein
MRESLIEWSQLAFSGGLLIRRRIADGDLAFFTTWCPAGTSMETLVAVEGHRWAIEDSFETAKNEFGLDHLGDPAHVHVRASRQSGRRMNIDPGPEGPLRPSGSASASCETRTEEGSVDSGSETNK